jgi:hypothetical protein
MKRPHNAAFRAVATRSPTSPLSWTRLTQSRTFYWVQRRALVVDALRRAGS